MLRLGIDTSGATGSVAVVETDSEKVVALGYIDVKSTHSGTLIPMLENLLRVANLELSQIDEFAVSVGPGSFTGLRISLSAVKGMAFALGKPICPVSTLRAMAFNYYDVFAPIKNHHDNISQEIILCPVIDARQKRVYNAIFSVDGKNICRLCDDRVVEVNILTHELRQYQEKGSDIILLGDAAGMFEGRQAPAHLRFANAVGVCMAAEETMDIKQVNPLYMTLPHAQRERYEEKKFERK